MTNRCPRIAHRSVRVMSKTAESFLPPNNPVCFIWRGVCRPPSAALWLQFHSDPGMITRISIINKPYVDGLQ
jgi:hypothetical protein